MATAEAAIIEVEMEHLEDVAESRGWNLSWLDDRRFLLGLPARDGTWFHVLVELDDYPAQPPAWHWCGQDGNELDQLCWAPKGGKFFHPSGRICAPWNRLAYSECDPKGPHGDWTLSTWKTNTDTKGCTNLCAMALRIAVELMAPKFAGRLS